MTTRISGGLTDLKKDSRDFQLEKLGGKRLQLPSTFLLDELDIENQDNTDYCTGFAITKASEYQEGVKLDPLYQFCKTKQIKGEYKSWGASLRDACKSAIRFGSLEQSKAPYTISNRRSEVADWRNWDDEYDLYAQKHRKKSYFAVSGVGDTFEDIKHAIYEYKSPVMAGVKWRDEWIDGKDGVVPEIYSVDGGFGHAFIFIGWVIIKEAEFLVAHLSNGKNIGDSGKFYFSKNIVDREIGRYGIYCFVDISPSDYKRDKWSRYQKIINFIIRLRNKYVKK